MRNLRVDLDQLESIFEFRQSEFSEPQQAYLDLQTGEILWVYESDDDYAAVMNHEPEVNAENRERVEAQPDRFIEIPECDTIDDNEMLRAFLATEWTSDEMLARRAREAYHGSIGKWKKDIDHNPEIIRAWRAFESKAAQRRALEFLAEHGVEPIAR